MVADVDPIAVTVTVAATALAMAMAMASTMAMAMPSALAVTWIRVFVIASGKCWSAEKYRM